MTRITHKHKPRKTVKPVHVAAAIVSPAIPTGIPVIQEAEAVKAVQVVQEVQAPQAEQAAQAEQAVPAPRFCTPVGDWLTQYEAVTGLSHRDAQPPLPCQDAALAVKQPRPLLLLADGAGSSAVSEIGSSTVVKGLARLLNSLESLLVSLLDQPTPPSATDATRFARMLTKHACGLQQDLAEAHRRPRKDFRCTLLLAILGQHHWLWLKIGDGAIVTERLSVLPAKAEADAESALELHAHRCVIGEAGKGEFANQTTFIDEYLTPDDVQSGVCPIDDLTGVALMSDGAAERLVAHDGSRVSDQLSRWWDSLRRDALKRRQLTSRLYAEDFTRGTSGDDCSIALAARGVEV